MVVDETVVVFVKGVEVLGDAGGIHKKKPGLFYNGPDRLERTRILHFVLF